jgi:hypothetical protein
MRAASARVPASSPGEGRAQERGDLLRLYESTVVAYLVFLIYLYPYGIPIASGVNLRVPDVMALFTLGLGAAAVLLRGTIWFDRSFHCFIGAFLLLELTLPVVGAMGYRQPTDVVSAIRMAMLWLPMLFLTMLAPPQRALAFEARLARVLRIALWLNLGYALVQVGVTIGRLPQWMLITSGLAAWTVDQQFELLPGLRPAGFFVGTTALSAFGIVCLCFFFARYVSGRSRSDLGYTLLSLLVVLVTTSRAAYAASVAILIAGWVRLPGGRKAALGLALLAGCAAALWAIERTVGISEAFYRFSRLLESGVLEDRSFGMRVYDIWPTALHAARDYFFGTLIQSPRALPLIDSGYLTYYLQGKWVSIAALALLLGGLWLLGLRAFLGPHGRRIGVMLLFLAIYLSVGMVIANPLRSPVIILFLIYAFWRVGAARLGVLVRPAEPIVPGRAVLP